MLAHLGAMLAHRGAMLARLGAMLAHLGAMLARLGAMLAHLGAMLAHLGTMLAHLGATLGQLGRLFWAYVGPCSPILSHKGKNMGEAKCTVKRSISHRSAAGANPLSPTERRECLRHGHGQLGPGGPWPDLKAYA